LTIDPYTPINPKPAGRSNIAIALVLATPIAIFTNDEPPINSEDIRIWRLIFFSDVATGLVAKEPSVSCNRNFMVGLVARELRVCCNRNFMV